MASTDKPAQAAHISSARPVYYALDANHAVVDIGACFAASLLAFNYDVVELFAQAGEQS